MKTLEKKIIIKGKIKALTGLHVGGTNSAMEIGGPDSTVIRNPVTNRPYIPGSSLKGKMRSLIEQSEGTIKRVNMGNVKHGPTDNSSHIAARLFGTAGGDRQIPSRIYVRDANMLSGDEMFSNTDMPYTESKTEVVIDRITAAAMPRQIERVPADTEFEMNLILNIFDDEDEGELIKTTFRALKLIEDDYIGGNGSRGYGQVKFQINEMIEKTIRNGSLEEDNSSLKEKYGDELEKFK